MDSMSMEPPPRTARGWWMDEAIAQDPGEPCPPLAAHTAADVVILGGGYTGMWTAYFLKERDPGIDVVLLEQDICGGGPSGRNGGFVNGYWSSIGELTHRFGDGDALELCLAASRSVAEIGRFCQRHDVDAWFTYGGELAVASNPFQEGSWERELGEARRLGAEDEFVELSADEVRKRVDSPVLLGGVFHPDAATVQPARLARGLRRVLLERGVRIFERTPVRRFAAADRDFTVFFFFGPFRFDAADLDLAGFFLAVRFFDAERDFFIGSVLSSQVRWLHIPYQAWDRKEIGSVIRDPRKARIGACSGAVRCKAERAPAPQRTGSYVRSGRAATTQQMTLHPQAPKLAGVSAACTRCAESASRLGSD